MTIGDDVLERLPPRPYDAFRGEVRDGDILLCSATDTGSRMIRWATKSQWSHIAIAFLHRDIDRVLALECVQRLGVRVVPLSDFIARTSSGIHPYPGRILLARHAKLADGLAASRLRTMTEFAFDRLGVNFSNVETAKIGLRILLGRLNIVLPGVVSADDEYICSEYVARCFERIGLKIPWDGLGFIAPADFAADPDIGAIAQVQT